MPKELILKCGGFDSSLIYVGEDKEIGIKLKKMGYKSVVDSRCLAYHYIGEAKPNEIKQKQYRNFYNLNKNRIKIVIKNYSILKIICLPILDFIMLFNPKRFKDLKKETIDLTKYINPDIKKKLSSSIIKKVIIVGGLYAISLITAYLWNIYNLQKTLHERFTKKNYLEEAQKSINNLQKEITT